MNLSRRAYQATAILAAATVPLLLAAGCKSAAGSAQSQPPAASTSAAPASAAPTPGTSGTGAPTSCSVITQAEAGAALGQQVKAPVLGKAVVEGGVACVFYGPSVPPGTSPDIPVGDSVRVVLVTGGNAKKWFDDYRGKVKAQPISGLGDAAYYDGYASISVLKGDAYVRIAVGIASNLSVEEQLARDALPRM